MLKMVDPDLDIIVMSNGLGGLDLHQLVDAIIDSCIPDLPPPPVDVPAEPVIGIFYSADTGRRLALEAIDGKQAIRIDGMTLPARRDTAGWLSAPLIPGDLRVLPSRDSMALELRECDRADLLRRVEPPAEITAGALVGEYRNAAAAIAAAIAEQDDGSALLTLFEFLGLDALSAGRDRSGAMGGADDRRSAAGGIARNQERRLPADERTHAAAVLRTMFAPVSAQSLALERRVLRGRAIPPLQPQRRNLDVPPRPGLSWLSGSSSR